MDTWRKEKYRLIADLVADEYHPDHIDRFRSLQEKYPHDGILRSACQVWIATIYQMNGKTTEALNLYERLLDDHEQLGGYFASVLLNTLKLLVSEGQRDEAHAMFSRYLHSDELHNFARLALISWYVENFEASEEELQTFRPLIDEVARQMGVTLSGMQMKSEILNLKQIDRESNHEYSRLQIALQHKGKEERAADLRQYIDKDPIPFYKNLAQQMLDGLEGEEG
jgi:tetratricopeptide (TPR) repeat protein